MVHINNQVRSIIDDNEMKLIYQRSVLGAKRLIYFFMNNIFNLKGNCVLRTLKNSFTIFWA